jgi:hypothetical protein
VNNSTNCETWHRQDHVRIMGWKQSIERICLVNAVALRRTPYGHGREVEESPLGPCVTCARRPLSEREPLSCEVVYRAVLSLIATTILQRPKPCRTPRATSRLQSLIDSTLSHTNFRDHGRQSQTQEQRIVDRRWRDQEDQIGGTCPPLHTPYSLACNAFLQCAQRRDAVVCCECVLAVVLEGVVKEDKAATVRSVRAWAAA